MIPRRGFLNLLLLAPLAKVAAAAGLWKPEPTFEPLNLKYTRIMGTMEITPEAMRVMYPRSREFEETLQRHLNDHRRILMDELERMSGISSASSG